MSGAKCNNFVLQGARTVLPWLIAVVAVVAFAVNLKARADVACQKAEEAIGLTQQIRQDHDGRLRSLEQVMARIDQRLANIERILLDGEHACGRPRADPEGSRKR